MRWHFTNGIFGGFTDDGEFVGLVYPVAEGVWMFEVRSAKDYKLIRQGTRAKSCIAMLEATALVYAG